MASDAAPKPPPQKPPLFTATCTSLLSDVRRLIERSRRVQDDVVQNFRPASATFSNTLLPLAQDEDERTGETNILVFYQHVSPDGGLRSASNQAQRLLKDFALQTAAREDLFSLIDAVLTKNEPLDPEARHFLEREHETYRRHGMAIPAGPSRQRFFQAQERLSQLSLEFRRNLDEENGGEWFSPDELDGVPERVLAGLETGQGDYKGQLRLTYKPPDVGAALSYARRSATRKQIFLANANKCNQNVPIITETLILRDEAARLLGYPDHASCRLDEKMEKSPVRVTKFLQDLRTELTARGIEEIEHLKKVKEADVKSRGEDFDGNYFLWDHAFYGRLMAEKELAIDQEKVSEYFPLAAVLPHMLEICQQLLGLQFFELTGPGHDLEQGSHTADHVWHSDVQLFSAWDRDSGGFLGYLYLDLYPRPGKYGHMSNFNLQPGYSDRTGQRRYPVTALVCNFPKPSPKQPSLLKHQEVWMLFHELGHAIHDLVGRTRFSRFHGTNVVQDFCEAPSQLLENWSWHHATLRSLSLHYSFLPDPRPKGDDDVVPWHSSLRLAIPERIPDEMIDRLCQTKKMNSALFYLGQLHVALFDMAVHSPRSHEEALALEPSRLWNYLRKDIVKIDGPEFLGHGYEWGHGEATFEHLFGPGDYDAGYYAYLSSQVYALDIFYEFFKSDPMNPQAGRRYRRMILENGGSRDEMSILVDYLGRQPKMDAFRDELGLTCERESILNRLWRVLRVRT